MKKLKVILLILTVLMSGMSLRAFEIDSIKTNRLTPMVVRIGSSAAINIGLTEISKSTIHQARPNFSGNDSWPSRHTSWIFTAASITTHELYCKSAWWVVGAHAVADAVAMQRVLSNNHFPKDVLGGAMIGLLSAEAGYYISDLLFPGSRVALPQVAADWLPSLDVTTTAFFPLCGGTNGYDGRTSVGTAIRMNMPITESFGFTATTAMRSTPMYGSHGYCSTISSAGLSLGLTGYADLPFNRWSAEGRVMPGFVYNFDGEVVEHPSCSFTFDITLGMNCRLTDDLAIGTEVGYLYWSLQRGMSAIQLGVFTRKLF